MPTLGDLPGDSSANYGWDPDDEARETRGRGMRLVTAITIVALVLPMAGGVLWLLSQAL